MHLADIKTKQKRRQVGFDKQRVIRTQQKSLNFNTFPEINPCITLAPIPRKYLSPHTSLGRSAGTNPFAEY